MVDNRKNVVEDVLETTSMKSLKIWLYCNFELRDLVAFKLGFPSLEIQLFLIAFHVRMESHIISRCKDGHGARMVNKWIPLEIQ
jgi:hypothetical protein